MTELLNHGKPADLLPARCKQEVSHWLAEDAPSFDYGGFVVGSEQKEAGLLMKSPGMIAGRPFFDEVFRQCGCVVSWISDEGVYQPETAFQHGPLKIANVTGPARQLLLAERVALNALARCSGIATKSRTMLMLAQNAGYRGIIAGTRKTTPGFRLVEKYGMLIGGIDAHRHDLSSMIMLKDNHIWSKGERKKIISKQGVTIRANVCALGSITKAVQAAKAAGGFSLKVEVECQSEQGADEAIEAGADVVMLDNFKAEQLRTVARTIKERWSGKRSFLLECSGGLTESNVQDYVNNGIPARTSSGRHELTKRIRYRHYLHKFRTPRCSTCGLFAEVEPLQFSFHRITRVRISRTKRLWSI